MKLIIDNANIDDIRSMYEYFPIWPRKSARPTRY